MGICTEQRGDLTWSPSYLLILQLQLEALLPNLLSSVSTTSTQFSSPSPPPRLKKPTDPSNRTNGTAIQRLHGHGQLSTVPAKHRLQRSCHPLPHRELPSHRSTLADAPRCLPQEHSLPLRTRAPERSSKSTAVEVRKNNYPVFTHPVDEMHNTRERTLARTDPKDVRSVGWSISQRRVQR